MFKTDRRVYRTTDGRLVEENDPEAAFLAYPKGEEVSDAEARRVGLTTFGGKSRARSGDKSVPPTGDKASGGLTINRASTKESRNA
jgi:hypothetical protein